MFNRHLAHGGCGLDPVSLEPGVFVPGLVGVVDPEAAAGHNQHTQDQSNLPEDSGFAGQSFRGPSRGKIAGTQTVVRVIPGGGAHFKGKPAGAAVLRTRPALRRNKLTRVLFARVGMSRRIRGGSGGLVLHGRPFVLC